MFVANCSVMMPTGARLRALLRDDHGQDLIEYALVASLLVIVMIAVVGDAGTEVGRLWTHIATELQGLP
jgi:Flp pilus assembly pilin Flp